MAERAPELGDFKGVSYFEAKFWVEGLFRANIYGPLNKGMVVLQLCFMEVFIQRNFVADF